MAVSKRGADAPSAQDSEFLTVEEAAVEVGLSTAFVQAQADGGLLPTVAVGESGNAPRVRRSALREWHGTLRQGQAAALERLGVELSEELSLPRA